MLRALVAMQRFLCKLAASTGTSDVEGDGEGALVSLIIINDGWCSISNICMLVDSTQSLFSKATASLHLIMAYHEIKMEKWTLIFHLIGWTQHVMLRNCFSLLQGETLPKLFPLNRKYGKIIGEIHTTPVALAKVRRSGKASKLEAAKVNRDLSALFTGFRGFRAS